MVNSKRNLRHKKNNIFDFDSSSGNSTDNLSGFIDNSSSNSHNKNDDNTNDKNDNFDYSPSKTDSNSSFSSHKNDSLDFSSQSTTLSNETNPKKQKLIKKKTKTQNKNQNSSNDANELEIYDPPQSPKIEQLLCHTKNGKKSLFLAKFKNLSHHNCKWVTEEDVISNANAKYRSNQLLKAFKEELEGEEEYAQHSETKVHGFSARFLFDPLFLQVDRVIRHRVREVEIVNKNSDLNDMEDEKESENKEYQKSDNISEHSKRYITEITIPSISDPAEVRTKFKKLLESDDLSGLIKDHVEQTDFLPSKRYKVRLQLLVKWKSVSLTSCTWESIPEPENNKNEFEITKYSSKKGLNQYLNKNNLRTSLLNAGKRYEDTSNLKLKLKKIGLKKHPTTKRDPRSLRKNRPPTLKNGVSFAQWKPPKYKNGNSLKTPYQEDGVKWLIYNWHMKRSCILADEMGLGKTIQTIGLVDYLFREQKLRGPFIIAAPKTTLQNWQREFENWTDFNVVNFDGIAAERKIIYENEFFFTDPTNKTKIIPNLTKFDVLLTSYAFLLSQKELWQLEYGLLVIDEAHRLKNPESSLYLRMQDYKAGHSVFLTGTPLQNNIGELWSLLSLLEPSIFHDREEFENRYDVKAENSAENIEELHKRVLKPFMLRRVKNDVMSSLPPPKEVVIWLRMTREQKKYFRAIYEQNTDFLYAEGRKNAPSLMNIFMQLRHCCNHPFVLRGVEERTKKEKQLNDEEAVMHALVNVSCKMDFLDKFLPMMRSQGHKVLIFSQFVMILDIIDDYLAWKGYVYERIDGNVSLDARQNAIDRFNKEEENFVFLLSTRAGGLGINLTSADTVIIYDSDWNPQNDLQAQARAHRIGQKKTVTVYRLVTKGTYEEIMFQKAGKKLGLEKALLQSWINSGRDIEKGKSGNLNKEELEKLIKFGAYHVLKDNEEDNKPQSINDILASSEVLYPLSEEKKNGENILGQATFKNTLDDNLSLDDPDFWKKIGLPKKKRVQNSYGKHRRRRKQAVQTFQPLSQNDSGSFTNPSTESDESFQSDEGSIWSRSDRKVFEEALLRFGYGRWEAIKLHSKISHKVVECKDLALGLISLYVEHRGRIAPNFLHSLRSELLESIQRERSGERGSVSGSENEVDDLSDRRGSSSTAVSAAERRRELYLMDIYSLLNKISLDPVLESSKWQKSRFSQRRKTEELKTLEMCWINNTIVEGLMKKPGFNPPLEMPQGILANLPYENWKVSDDMECVRLAYVYGIDNWVDKFKQKTDSKNDKNNEEKLNKNKLARRLPSFLYRSKHKVLSFENSKNLRLPTAETLRVLHTKYNALYEGTLKEEAKQRATKLFSRAFKRFVLTFPIKNPGALSSWVVNGENLALSGAPNCSKSIVFQQSEDWKTVRARKAGELLDTFKQFLKEIKRINEAGKKSGSEMLNLTDNQINFFDFTQVTAKKAMRRLSLFEKIFELIKLPDLSERLSIIKLTSFPVSGWKVPKSDMQLLRGVLKHGFGNWGFIHVDKEFDSLFESTDMPKDHKICTRIEQLHNRITTQLAKEQKQLLKKKLSNIPKPPIDIINLLDSSDEKKSAKINNKRKNKTKKKEKSQLKNIKKDKFGNLVLPAKVSNGVTIHRIGRINFKTPKWHTSRSIFPQGYYSSCLTGLQKFENRILAYDNFSKTEKSKVTSFFSKKLEENKKYLSFRPIFCVTVKNFDKEGVSAEEKSPGLPNGGSIPEPKGDETFYSLSLASMSEKIKNITKNKEDGKPLLATQIFGLRQEAVVMAIEELDDARLCKEYSLKFITPSKCKYSAEGREFLSKNKFFLAMKGLEEEKKGGSAKGNLKKENKNSKEKKAAKKNQKNTLKRTKQLELGSFVFKKVKEKEGPLKMAEDNSLIVIE